MEYNSILETATKYATRYLEDLTGRSVFPGKTSLAELDKLEFPLPVESTGAGKVLDLLHSSGSPNTVASNGGRYFGFVFGGTLPVSMAANWLAAAWDQNACFRVTSPVAARIEKVTGNWLKEILQLPTQSAVGFVTGTTMANFCGVLAARQKICVRNGWDIKANGFNGAPPIRVIAGEEIHASMLKALMLAGFGTENIEKVPTDDNGAIIAEEFPETDASTLICLQAGNVNTGAIDPVHSICLKAKDSGAWVHVDGAFGLWAAASPNKSSLIEGVGSADSWAIDLHKWLNIPYDSGAIICKEPAVLQQSLSVNAAYLPDSVNAEPSYYTPEMSRRARGIEAWAALYALGRNGVAKLIDRCCRLAVLFAEKLETAGFQILNTVVLNQVLVSFGDAAVTHKVIQQIQEDGTCWCAGTVWKGQTAMRISVSSWVTTENDIEVCSDKIIAIANRVTTQSEIIAG